MSRLLGKTAVITGSDSGFGRACALLFADEGANVVVNGRSQQRIDGVVETITANGGSAIGALGDVSIEADVEGVIVAAIDRFGGLDVMCNNAGVPPPMRPVETITEAEFDACSMSTSSECSSGASTLLNRCASAAAE